MIMVRTQMVLHGICQLMDVVLDREWPLGKGRILVSERWRGILFHGQLQASCMLDSWAGLVESAGQEGASSSVGVSVYKDSLQTP